MLSKRENIAEYILHLWQIEDYLRAFPEQAESNKQLQDISRMMHEEGIIDHGHLQIAEVALHEIEELVCQLMQTDATLRAAMLQLAPQLALIKSKSDDPSQSDIRMMFVFLYNIMLLRLQHKDISAETLALQQQVSRVLKHLSQAYLYDHQEPI